MPRRSEQEVEETLTRLEKVILENPDGLSRPEIQDRYRSRHGVQLPGRSVIRWLNQLDDEGRIRIEGITRNRRYLPPESAVGKTPVREGMTPSRPEATSELAGEVVLLSEDSAELQRLIQRPRAMREPIGYNRNLLGAYDPSLPSSWYLPEDVRERLHGMGQTPDPERPAGTYARDILEPLLIDLSWSSSRLEGNTYSRADTEELIKMGKAAEGKDPEEAQMILNHKAAIQHLVDHADEVRVDRLTFRVLHAHLSENLMRVPGREGALRTGPVQISDSTYTPIAIPQVIEECFDEMLQKAAAIPDAFEQAFFVMVHLPYLQAFWDVNKRTSRIAANVPLFRRNLVPLSFIDVPRDLYLEAMLIIYEVNRIEPLRDIFEWAYDRSCRRYRVIRESLRDRETAPDPIRLRYRAALGSTIQTIVLRGSPPHHGALLALGRERDVAPEDVDAFADRALEILRSLNEGTAGRYGISLEAFEAWKAGVTELQQGESHDDPAAKP